MFPALYAKKVKHTFGIGAAGIMFDHELHTIMTTAKQIDTPRRLVRNVNDHIDWKNRSAL